MADNKMRCCVILRLEKGSSTMVAKYDHASQTESHGASGALYGGKDKNYADAVQEAVSKDPPGGLSGGFGGFKVVQSDAHQLVYGADKAGCCTFQKESLLMSVCVCLQSSFISLSFQKKRHFQWNFPYFPKRLHSTHSPSLVYLYTCTYTHHHHYTHRHCRCDWSSISFESGHQNVARTLQGIQFQICR